MLIWAEGGEHSYTGHVAIIHEVSDSWVRIAEQNYRDYVWPAEQNFARQLTVEIDGEGHFWIKNRGVLGWMHVKDSRTPDPGSLALTPPSDEKEGEASPRADSGEQNESAEAGKGRKKRDDKCRVN